MHPRSDNCVGQGQPPWPAARRKRAQLLLDFVRERGAIHPREHFSHGKVKNYWGGSSNATTRSPRRHALPGSAAYCAPRWRGSHLRRASAGAAASRCRYLPHTSRYPGWHRDPHLCAIARRGAILLRDQAKKLLIGRLWPWTRWTTFQ